VRAAYVEPSAEEILQPWLKIREYGQQLYGFEEATLPNAEMMA
jgi:hypothetical protein